MKNGRGIILIMMTRSIRIESDIVVELILYKLLFYFVVLTHHLAILGFIISTPLILIYEPLWISLPLITWIIYLVFGKLECPHTRWENYLRGKLGKPRIKTFIKYYYLDKLRRK